MRWDIKWPTIFLCQLVCGLLLFQLFKGNSSSSNKLLLVNPSINDNVFKTTNLSPHIQLFNLDQVINDSFRCIESKTMLDHVKTHICLYGGPIDLYVSGSFRGNSSIWEEGGVKLMLDILFLHPHLDFIDIGANIGTYTMYAAALGRFVLAVDCFRPNLERIARAVQLRNVANRVVLVENALFTTSGKLLRLNRELSNIGSQYLIIDSGNQTMKQEDPYVVRTIQFNDLLPILVDRKVRGAFIKMDVEKSESFVVASGDKVFDTIDIPYVLMEWGPMGHIPDRVKILLNFFNTRQYEPRTLSCRILNQTEHLKWPTDILWVKKNFSGFC